MNLSLLQKKLDKKFGGKVHVREEKGSRIISGEMDDWNDIIRACYMCASKFSSTHVVNDIVFTGAEDRSVWMPSVKDDSLEGAEPDVLIIGGGVSGCATFREMCRYDCDVLLIEKGTDLAAGTSSRNTGEVHPGVDLGKGSLKQKYEIKGNYMYDQVCRELNVPFERCGQFACIRSGWLRIPLGLLAIYRRTICGTRGTRIMGEKELYTRNPNLEPGFKFAVYDWSAGVVCPYGLTIAYAENGVQNGGKVSLETACLGMTVEDGIITEVKTNRGTIRPKLVINAAGTYCEEIARMAGDRFYSIHPRKGTNSIMDKKSRAIIQGVASGALDVKNIVAHTKGGCIAPTAHGNLLVGPDAVETWEKENYATEASSIHHTFAKEAETADGVCEKSIITYFTGVRAPTFEEDFILEKGRAVKNIIHEAGIQSPGLTAAPAFAVDMAYLASDMINVRKKRSFNPYRKGYGHLAELTLKERADKIKENPDYGEIVCRCEEISKGEILDALNAPICVPTADGIKRRVRPGSGRCQGGFCGPLVTKIIADFLQENPDKVTKNGEGSFINFPSEGEK